MNDATSPYLLFLDESGDPTMQYANREAPAVPEVFLLCGCLLEREEHLRAARVLDDLKRCHLGRTDVPLVSRQLRRHKGAFRVLDDPILRARFQAGIGALIDKTNVTVFAAGIDKFRYWQRYGESARSPYDVALAFILERVVSYLSGQRERIQVIAESRGRREDSALSLEFARLLREGTRYATAERLRSCFLPALSFRHKKDNVTGLQMADLVAYPLANRLCHPESRRVDFDIVRTKLHRSRRGVWGAGLKVFPPAKASDYGL